MGDSLRPPRRWTRNFPDPEDDDALTPDEFRESVYEPLVRVRRPEPDLPADPAVWLASNKMTQTEVCLRLAQYLLANRLTTTDVTVALTGYELTRRDRPRFPVTRFLTERGTQPKRLTDGWRGNYLLKGGANALHLTNKPDVADVVTTLTSGGRLLAHVSRGLLESSRSPAEHKLLRGAIGRAITCKSAGPFDLLAAVVPRSKRFRELATEWRATEGATRARLLILTVDRAGNVDGLPHDDA